MGLIYSFESWAAAVWARLQWRAQEAIDHLEIRFVRVGRRGDQPTDVPQCARGACQCYLEALLRQNLPGQGQTKAKDLRTRHP